MFDEYIRAWDGWNAHLAYVKEAKEQALEQGIEQGLQQGIEQGLQQGREEGIEQGIAQEREKTVNMLVGLIKKGVITKEYACKDLGMSEKELEEHL